jgi:flavin reductase (DIM6/NTAB) family NADH-FMN oxidoreductase RutF
VKPTSFQQAMRQLAGAVAIVSVGTGDDRTGMTVSSVCSLSLEPASLLVCIGRQSSTWRHLQRYGAFGVSILGAAHQPIAERFAAGGARGNERFSGATWTTLVTGAPLLVGALAAIDCDVEEMFDRHSHAIVIGRVREIRIDGQGDGLVYWRGRYDKVRA